MGAGASTASGAKAANVNTVRNVRAGSPTDNGECLHGTPAPGKENMSETSDDFDDFDRMVQRINTVGPEPQYVQPAPPPTGPALENPARGFQPCPTMELFKKSCGSGVRGRQVTVNAQEREVLVEQYFGPEAEERREVVRRQCDAALVAAKAELQALRSSRNPPAIMAGLQKYSAMGEAIAAEWAVLIARCTKLTDRARVKMAQALARGDPPQDLVRLLDRFFSWPNVNAEARALIQLMEDHLVAAYSLPDLVQMDGVLDEYACSAAYTTSTLAGLRRNRERLVNAMRSRMQQAVKWKDPRDIAKLLKQTNACEEVADLRGVLQGRLTSLCDMITRILEPLVTSSEFPQVEGALLKYQSYPEHIKDAWERLRERRDQLLQTAKATLRELLDTYELRKIDAALAKYADYAEAVENERVDVIEHRKWLLRNAVLEMRSLAADSSATVPRVVAALERYGSYPNVQAELKDLQERVVQLVAVACTLTDIEAVTHAVEECADAEQYAPHEYEQLLGNYALLAEAMNVKLQAALERHESRELEAMYEESLVYGVGVQKQRQAVHDVLAELAASAMREMEELMTGSDYVTIERAIAKYSDYLNVIVPIWKRLQAHRISLLNAARSELTAMLESSDSDDIAHTLAKYVPYGEVVVAERTKLEQWRDQLIMVDVLQELVHSEDFVAVLQTLERYKDCDESGRAAWNNLRRWRDELVAKAKAELKKLLAVRSFDEVCAGLATYADYEDFVEAERAAVIKWRDRLGVVRELESLCDSDDFGAIETALSKHASATDQPAVQNAHRLLSTRRDQMVAAVQAALRQLVDYVAPVAMGTALKRYADYSDACSEEFKLVQEKRKALIVEANSKLNEAVASADTDIPTMQELINAYYSFPQEEVGEAMEKLQAKLAEATATADRLARQRKHRAEQLRTRRETMVASETPTRSVVKHKFLAAVEKIKVDEALQMMMKQHETGQEPEQDVPADANAATEDVVMDGVEAVLSGDMQEAVGNFMTSLKAHPKDPVCAYNLSCCFALMGQSETAVKWFDLSVQWGIASHTELDDPSNDPDLKSLSENEEFQDLVGRVHAQRAN
jgi:hypothetical protein